MDVRRSALHVGSCPGRRRCGRRKKILPLLSLPSLSAELIGSITTAADSVINIRTSISKLPSLIKHKQFSRSLPGFGTQLGLLRHQACGLSSSPLLALHCEMVVTVGLLQVLRHPASGAKHLQGSRHLRRETACYYFKVSRVNKLF